MNKLELPKNTTVVVTPAGDATAALQVTAAVQVENGVTTGTLWALQDGAKAIFLAIFPDPGTYFFPGGLVAPKVNSIQTDFRHNRITVRASR